MELSGRALTPLPVQMMARYLFGANHISEAMHAIY